MDYLCQSITGILHRNDSDTHMNHTLQKDNDRLYGENK